jgi:hypothetical protein
MQATTEKPVSQPVKASYRAGRGGDGRFLRGSRGNPEGRPLGSRNRASILMENLLDGQADALTRKVIKMALTGDVLALRLCLERLMPVRRERSLTLRLPAPATAQDIAGGFASVVEALAHGELTPSETSAAAELLESARRALETTDLAKRIEELEARAEEAEEYGQQAET